MESYTNTNISEFNVELAARLISDAAAGRITHFSRDVTSLKFYKLYLSLPFRIIRALFHILLLILLFYDVALFDSKSVVAKVTVSLEVLAMMFYLTQLIIVFRFSLKRHLFRDIKHYITLCSLLITLLDIILFFTGVYRFRISPFTRVLLFINSAEQHQIRRHLRTLKATILKSFTISPFLFTFYFMMVAFIYKFFSKKKIECYTGKPYMQNLKDVIWESLVYVTSSNSPDVMLPAFADESAVGVLFLIFYATFFFLLIFVYGLIMGKFRDNAKDELKLLLIAKFSLVNDAFTLLSGIDMPHPVHADQQNNANYELVLKSSTNSTDSNSELCHQQRVVVTKQTWIRLMKFFPKYSKKTELPETLFYLLAGPNKDCLCKEEFIYVGDLLSVPLSIVPDSLHIFERYFWFHCSNRLADFVEGKIFNLIIAIMIVANMLVITFTSELITELIFCILFILEILLRIYVKGPRRFFRSLLNIFDFTIIFLAFIFWFVNQSNFLPDSKSEAVTFTLLILRNLRLIKLLRGIAMYHQLLHILGMLLPTICSLLLIIFCFTVMYMCVGVWIYGGLFHYNHNLWDYYHNSAECNSTELVNSEFCRLHYSILSFNSFIAGFVTLCSVSVGNNWHVITEGFAIGSKKVIVSRIYFAVFKGGMTYLLLLIVAFVLDIFLLVYNQQSGLMIEETIKQRLKERNIEFVSYKQLRDARVDKETPTDQVDGKVSNTYRLHLKESGKFYFRLQSKGAKSVEYVSQALFQAEIEENLKVNSKYKYLFQ